MKTADQFVIDYIKTNYSEINVHPGKCRFNFRCSYNSVHDAINNNEEKIAMVFYFDINKENNPIIHFVNVDNNNKFIDNTLGHWSSKSKFFLIKYIYKEEFFNVNDIFVKYREEIKNKIPWYIRMFTSKDNLIF